MKNNKNIPNDATPVTNKLKEDDILRCVDCNLICSLILNYKEGISYILNMNVKMAIKIIYY